MVELSEIMRMLKEMKAEVKAGGRDTELQNQVTEMNKQIAEI